MMPVIIPSVITSGNVFLFFTLTINAYNAARLRKILRIMGIGLRFLFKRFVIQVMCASYNKRFTLLICIRNYTDIRKLFLASCSKGNSCSRFAFLNLVFERRYKKISAAGYRAAKVTQGEIIAGLKCSIGGNSLFDIDLSGTGSDKNHQIIVL